MNQQQIAVIVNGESHLLPINITVVHLVERLGLADKRIAVEINGEIITRDRHPTHCINTGDLIEVVRAIGGG